MTAPDAESVLKLRDAQQAARMASDWVSPADSRARSALSASSSSRTETALAIAHCITYCPTTAILWRCQAPDLVDMGALQESSSRDLTSAESAKTGIGRCLLVLAACPCNNGHYGLVNRLGARLMAP